MEVLRDRARAVWQCSIDKSELDAYRSRMNVIPTRLRNGRTLMRVVGDNPPEPGFENVPGAREDLYLSTLSDVDRAQGA